MGRAVLCQYQNITTQNVIHIDPLLRQNIDIRNVIGSTLEVIINFGTTDDQGIVEAELIQLTFQCCCLAVGLKTIKNDQLAVTRLAGKR